MHRVTIPPILLLVIALGLTACEEAVNPFLESDRNYTLFGTLDLARDTQYVRVIPIRQALETDASAPLNISFTTEDLQTGEIVDWRDSVVTFANGNVGHVFYAPMRVRSGHTYRVEVTPTEGTVVTSAETTAPGIPRAEVLPEDVSGGVFGVSDATQTVIWRGISRDPFRIDQYYRFMMSPSGIFRDVLLPYEPSNEGVPPDAWEVDLNLREDKRTLDTLISTRDVPLAGLGMQVTMLDPAFSPPDGRFDPEVLVQPGTMSNVSNGFGFVGSVGRFSVEWVLDRDNVDRLGYVTLDHAFDAAPGRPMVKILPFEWSAMPQ